MWRLPNLTQSAVIRYGGGLLLIAVALLFLWPGLAANLLSTGMSRAAFMPHGHCYLWVPQLVWLHVTSDLLIGISYVAISLTLAYMVNRARRDIPFHWVFLAFGLFIIACGATHFLEVVTLWNATYWLSGYVKLITAAASLATAVVLPWIVPRTLFLVRAAQTSDERQSQLEQANSRLEVELARRTQAENDLREANQMLEAVFESSPLAIYAVDPEGRTLTWNPAAERIFGWSETEAVGQVLPFVSAEAREEFRQLRGRVLRGEGFINVETQRRRKDGSIVEVAVSAAPWRDANGEIRGAIGITADITERRRAELERDAERRLLDALINQLPVGVMFRDVQGTFTRTNPQACHILGLAPGELTGMTAAKLVERIRPITPAGELIAVEEYPTSVALSTRQETGPVELTITTPAGETRNIVSRASPVTDHRGEAAGVVAVISDVTEQRSLQEQLRLSQKMEAIGTLAGGVAHDFNNLLTAIIGNTQLALGQLSADDPLQESLLEIEKAGSRAAALTRQLLAFSRRQRLERRTLNLNDTINEITKMLRRVIGEDIEVRVEESAHLHPVFADPAQVEQVLMNLAVNARDAMPGGGRLTIETRNVTLDEEYRREHSYARPGRYVQVSLSDTGMGMEGETRARIFEPFFTTKEVGRGTGLGLAMVFGIVKQHGGMIEVESEVGRGSTFHIFWPVHEEAFSAEEPEEVLPPLRGGEETILIAEDEEALRRMTKTILEGLGYNVLLAEDGVEAVEIFAAHRERIALVMLDIVMPRMGGQEAYERISAQGGARVPVIFMTGYSVEIAQNSFIKKNQFIEETGATLMQKPYTLETLGRTVREVLDAAS